MTLYEFSYEDKGCHKLFKTYRHQVKIIKKSIEKQLTRQLTHDFAKVKLASRIPFRGYKCYECRVNPPQLPPIRVAFYITHQQVMISYITTNITKAEFTHEFEHFVNNN